MKVNPVMHFEPYSLIQVNYHYHVIFRLHQHIRCLSNLFHMHWIYILVHWSAFYIPWLHSSFLSICHFLSWHYLHYLLHQLNHRHSCRYHFLHLRSSHNHLHFHQKSFVTSYQLSFVLNHLHSFVLNFCLPSELNYWLPFGNLTFYLQSQFDHYQLHQQSSSSSGCFPKSFSFSYFHSQNSYHHFLLIFTTASCCLHFHLFVNAIEFGQNYFQLHRYYLQLCLYYYLHQNRYSPVLKHFHYLLLHFCYFHYHQKSFIQSLPLHSFIIENHFQTWIDHQLLLILLLYRYHYKPCQSCYCHYHHLHQPMLLQSSCHHQCLSSTAVILLLKPQLRNHSF